MEGEQNKEKTLQEVASDVVFKGANLWILACAIMIASIGLNVNSTAVIIGAMLISPLMSPIIGAGFALGTYDFSLLKKALINLMVATVVSLLVSTVYFFISPFKDVQSELLARTTPTIYDVLIAFFGGLVGVIAITRVKKGNPIPGVAIATALMPPLCTAGFGLAIGNFPYFFGAFYLYCINCVFICIATFLIVKLMNYPSKSQVDERRQKQVRNLITLLIILMLIPSSYLAYTLFREQQFKKNTDYFIEKEFNEKGYTLVYKRVAYKENPKRIELAFLSKRFKSEEITTLNAKLADYNLNNTKLVFRQDTTDRYLSLKGELLNELGVKSKVVNQKDILISQLEGEIAKNTFDNKQILLEVNTIFDSIKSLSIANHGFNYMNDSSQAVTIVVYDRSKALSKEENERLEQWLKKRLNLAQVEVYKRNKF